jgi:ferritin-like metal-binding protein YciE
VVFPKPKRMRAMGLFTKDIKTMNDLFVHQLQDIYYAENQLVKALPKMAEKATDKQLKQGFLTHLDETKTHVQRLEQVFQTMSPASCRRRWKRKRRPTRN